MKKKSISIVLALLMILLVRVLNLNENNVNVNSNDDNLEVHFIDVGQADSILIKKGMDFMLIDGGNNADGELVVDYLKEQNVDKLKYVIGTHPHEDHIGGLDNVIDNFDVEKVIMPNAIATTRTFEDLLDSISNKELKITKPKVGDKYSLNGATFTILAPNQEKYDDLNNYSVVVKLTYGENSFLFTGDAEKLSESEMLKANKPLLKSDVLKVGHHGSATSTSKDFFEAVNPKFAVICVGEGNDYNHPHKKVVDRLTDKGIKIYRTDFNGTIILISDGKNISFH